MNRIFLDSNLLIYLATGKTDKADSVSNLINQSENAFISVQVLNEFASVCFKKGLLKPDQIQKYISEYNVFFEVTEVNFRNVFECFSIKKRYKFAWYDSLIITTALLNECTILYSEDMQHGQLIENKLTIINPFKSDGILISH